VYVRLAGLECFEEHWESAAQLGRQAIDTATEAQAHTPRIWAYNYLGWALGELGNPEAGVALLDRSYREALEHDIDVVAGNALNNKIVSLLAYARARDCLPLIDTMRDQPLGIYK
jgi:hypothetical protein